MSRMATISVVNFPAFAASVPRPQQIVHRGPRVLAADFQGARQLRDRLRAPPREQQALGGVEVRVVVRATIRGVISSRNIRIGGTVQPGQQVFTVVDTNSIVANVYIPEKDLRLVGVGKPVIATSAAYPGVEYHGRIQRICPVVDAATGTHLANAGPMACLARSTCRPVKLERHGGLLQVAQRGRGDRIRASHGGAVGTRRSGRHDRPILRQ